MPYTHKMDDRVEATIVDTHFVETTIRRCQEVGLLWRIYGV